MQCQSTCDQQILNSKATKGKLTTKIYILGHIDRSLWLLYVGIGSEHRHLWIKWAFCLTFLLNRYFIILSIFVCSLIIFIETGGNFRGDRQEGHSIEGGGWIWNPATKGYSIWRSETHQSTAYFLSYEEPFGLCYDFWVAFVKSMQIHRRW